MKQNSIVLQQETHSAAEESSTENHLKNGGSLEGYL